MPPARKPKLVQTGTGWKFRARQTNGERPWIHLPAMPREKAEKLALETANLLKTHTVEAIPRRKSEEETVSDWFSRWCKLRRTKGLRTVDDDESRFENHIKPLIGERPMSLVTKVDIERLRDTLDARIRERQAVEIDLSDDGDPKTRVSGRKAGMAGKSAANVWGLVVKMFSDATRSKQRDLRVRDDNPTRDVEGPDETPKLEGPFLYPTEFQQLMQCREVPLKARRLVALATYTYTRQGELRARRWRNIDLEHHRIAILTAIDRKTGVEGPTKTSSPRTPEIEPELVPLLEALKGEPDERLTWMPPAEDSAALLRLWLWQAGIRRRELHAPTRTTRPMTWHDLRHTACTWAAARGDSVFAIKARSGHEDLKTLQGYVEKWGNVRKTTFGEPFPKLFFELTGPPERTTEPVTVAQPSETIAEEEATPTGIETIGTIVRSPLRALSTRHRARKGRRSAFGPRLWSRRKVQ
jgi:integrase